MSIKLKGYEYFLGIKNTPGESFEPLNEELKSDIEGLEDAKPYVMHFHQLFSPVQRYRKEGASYLEQGPKISRVSAPVANMYMENCDDEFTGFHSSSKNKFAFKVNSIFIKEVRPHDFTISYVYTEYDFQALMRREVISLGVGLASNRFSLAETNKNLQENPKSLRAAAVANFELTRNEEWVKDLQSYVDVTAGYYALYFLMLFQAKRDMAPANVHVVYKAQGSNKKKSITKSVYFLNLGEIKERASHERIIGSKAKWGFRSMVKGYWRTEAPDFVGKDRQGNRYTSEGTPLVVGSTWVVPHIRGDKNNKMAIPRITKVKLPA